MLILSPKIARIDGSKIIDDINAHPDIIEQSKHAGDKNTFTNPLHDRMVTDALPKLKFGDQVDVTSELINMGNIMGENIVVIACPNVSPTSLAMNGCTNGEVKTTVPSISALNGSEPGNRRITMRIDSTVAMEWTIQIDPENRLVDINRENNLASISIEIEEESGLFESFIDTSDGGSMNIVIVGLLGIIGSHTNKVTPYPP